MVYYSERMWIKVSNGGTSLVVQWLGICLGMQGRQVGSLGTQDPTYLRAATEPVCSRAWHCNEGLARPNKILKTKISKGGRGAEVRVHESLHTSSQMLSPSGVVTNVLTSPSKDM